ncbi:site-specific integrase [Chitinophaga polysaccharea]|uniref:site-specific integrase n=1 Tax=Chitinophaga polysaccharea TaxID=1293035 RepID=UPI00145596E6|nr:site-specific integrase [Chitinophaga polysaccharea]NLR56925.1 site-specific integrase [Chitinophaga polysaccharea]
MLLSIKPICPKSKVRRDGTAIIFIQYCGPDNKKTLLNTEIAIPPGYWNRKYLRISSELPEKYGSADQLSLRLTNLVRLAEDIVSYGRKNKVSDILGFLKKTFHPDFNIETLEDKRRQVVALNPKSNPDLFFQIDDYIKCKTGKVALTTLSVYRAMKTQLEAFQAYRETPITFDSLDYNFYESFVSFLEFEYIQCRRKELTKGLRVATIGKTIKQFRIFVKDRVRRKYIPPIDLSEFKILDEETDAIYLTWAEIATIFRLDLTDYPHLVKYRDLFVLGCLIGLRFSDSSSIRPEDIRQGMLHKKQRKSDHRVVIPLMDVAEEILVNRFNGQIPKISNAEFNRYIKEIAMLAGIREPIKFSFKKGNKDIEVLKPKYAWVTSHTCRRSFCTNEFLAGTPVELIMKISGHKSLRDFYKYIRITPEEAGRKIREIWAQRGDIDLKCLPEVLNAEVVLMGM